MPLGMAVKSIKATASDGTKKLARKNTATGKTISMKRLATMSARQSLACLKMFLGSSFKLVRKKTICKNKVVKGARWINYLGNNNPAAKAKTTMKR
jgi:hypothetical protein